MNNGNWLLVVSTTMIAAAIAGSIFLPNWAPNRSAHEMEIVSETGHRIPSLFYGIGDHADLVPMMAKTGTSQGCKNQNWFVRLITVGTVFAADCHSSPCGDHYMSVTNLTCAVNCEGTYEHFSSSPLTAGYCYGWNYTGDGSCPANDASGNCRCEEIGCWSCE